MGIVNKLQVFLSEEDGAATVDWVMGTALGVSLALAVANSVSGGVEALATNISDTIGNYEFMNPF